MKAMRATVSNKKELRNCWIYENNQYIHADEMHGGKLPYVDKKDECVLKENSIPYRSSQRNGQDVFEYWNPVCFEEQEETAPLYAKLFGKYYYLKKNYTAKKPSKQMVEMAEVVRARRVSTAVEQHHRNLRQKELYQEAKEFLDGGVIALKEVKHHGFINYQDFKMDGGHIMCLPILDAKRNYLDAVAMFDLNKVASGGYLTLQVPKELSGWIKGKGGANIKEWEAKVGAKKIILWVY